MPLPQITWGDWIWFPEGEPAKDAPVGARFFRRTFRVPAGTFTRATLRLSVDDKFIAYLNGERLGSHNTWRSFREFNITKRLQPGTNVVAVRAENTPVPHANPAGLLCSLEFIKSSRETSLLDAQTVVSDNIWRVSATEQAGWTNVVFDDADWTAAKVIAKYGTEPWERLPEAGHQKYMVPYAAGIPGIVRVIYLPVVHPLVINRIEDPSAYRASWFDPVTFHEEPIGDVASDDQGHWRPPEPPRYHQDWVLILRKP